MPNVLFWQLKNLVDKLNPTNRKNPDMNKEDLFHPALPYAGKSGHIANSETSTARAIHEDESGVTASRQKQILDVLEKTEYGNTWKELSEKLGLHHGQISGALSVLHKSGRIFALKRTREGSQIYLHARFRDDHSDALRLDIPAVTKATQNKEAFNDLLAAVETFLNAQTFQTVHELRTAYEALKALEN